MSERTEAVERLIAALRARDVKGIGAELHPEVEAQGRRGPFRGVAEVVRWAKPNDDGNLISRVELDELREVGERYVAADARREWRWKEDDELAAEDRFGALFEFRDGAIVGWRQDFASIIDAIDAIST
jgi:hypothetical protein